MPWQAQKPTDSPAASSCSLSVAFGTPPFPHLTNCGIKSETDFLTTEHVSGPFSTVIAQHLFTDLRWRQYSRASGPENSAVPHSKWPAIWKMTIPR